MDSMRVKNITLTVESRLDPKGTDFSQSCSGNPGEKNNLCIRTKSGWKGIFWCEDSSKKTKYKEACCTALLVSSTSVFSFFRHCCEECHVREGRWESTARMINPLKRKFFFGSGRDSCAIDTAPLPFLWYMHTFFPLFIPISYFSLSLDVSYRLWEFKFVLILIYPCVENVIVVRKVWFFKLMHVIINLQSYTFRV